MSLNHCFISKNNNLPVFTVPLITKIKLASGLLLVLILCLEIDENSKKVANYRIFSSYEDVLREYILIKNEDEIYFYQNGGKGEKYKSDNIPATLNEDFPKFLYQCKEITEELHISDVIYTTYYFYLQYKKENTIKVYQGNYCVKAYTV
jgi:hypothetical protein